jgi:hypothetical protein
VWRELIIRWLVGGSTVCAFAILGDLFKPKSFAGLFAAAPSIALATLGLAMATHGEPYCAVEGRSMIPGAIALAVYSQVVSWRLMRHSQHAVAATALTMPLWFIVAFGLWFLALR